MNNVLPEKAKPANAGTNEIAQADATAGVMSSEPAVMPEPEAEMPGEAVVTSEAETRPLESIFPVPNPTPTQDGGAGFSFDFNSGVRVHVPEGRWHIAISDRRTQSVVVEAVLGNATIVSEKRYFMDARIEITNALTGEKTFTHEYDAKDRDVGIFIPAGTLGDAIGWFSYAVRFQEVHQCRLHLAVADFMKALFQERYPHINMMSQESFEGIKASLYATYCIGLFFHDEPGHMQPNDFRLVGLHRTAGSILGVPMDEKPPMIHYGQDGDLPPINDPYVVIGAQSSSQCKMWNYPGGWDEVVTFLKENGYRVICIDRENVTGSGRYLNFIPHGAEDQTGDRPLQERARWLRHAAFFVGLSSGLSWLAWAARTPVVMISGFTHPSNEFATPYRVFNHNVCNSCWHDVRLPFEHKNYTFCPRHKDTDRQFECSAKITPALVKAVIARAIADHRAGRDNACGRDIAAPSAQRVDPPLTSCVV